MRKTSCVFRHGALWLRVRPLGETMSWILMAIFSNLLKALTTALFMIPMSFEFQTLLHPFRGWSYSVLPFVFGFLISWFSHLPFISACFCSSSFPYCLYSRCSYCFFRSHLSFSFQQSQSPISLQIIVFLPSFKLFCFESLAVNLPWLEPVPIWVCLPICVPHLTYLHSPQSDSGALSCVDVI